MLKVNAVDDIKTIIEKFKTANIRALGKAITLVENRDKDSEYLLE